MKKVQIKVSGCDDTTIVEMEVSELEFAFLERLAALTKETSTYGCMPVITLEVI
jgi:hypothetical protein